MIVYLPTTHYFFILLIIFFHFFFLLLFYLAFEFDFNMIDMIFIIVTFVGGVATWLYIDI